MRAPERAKRHSKEAVRTAQKEWLAQVMRATGQTLSRIANEAGVPNTTLTRFYNREDYSGALHQTTVQRISESYGIPGPGIALPIPMHLREDAVPFQVADAPTQGTAVEMLIGERRSAFAMVMRSDILQLVGVRVGDIMIIDQEAQPHDGDVVCAQIEHGTGARTVFRVYQAPHLIGASHDPVGTRPELVDGVRVRIVGVMTDLLRRRHT